VQAYPRLTSGGVTVSSAGPGSVYRPVDPMSRVECFATSPDSRRCRQLRSASVYKLTV